MLIAVDPLEEVLLNPIFFAEGGGKLTIFSLLSQFFTLLFNQSQTFMSLSAHKPIGIFDSGVGGLTVLRELDRQLPTESIIYFGDTARLPYGIRSQEEIVQYVREIMQWMLTQDVKMVIMACNTSSALALDVVSQEFDLPILGLILPGAASAVAVGKRIGVIATSATAASKAYSRAILEVNPQAQVWEVGCPEFVPLIEGNRLADPYTYEVARKYLAPLIEQEIDVLVYGCTHYPHLAGVLKTILPPEVRLIDPAQALVMSARQELQLGNIVNSAPALPTRFYVSGCPESFAIASQHFLKTLPVVKKVYLEKTSYLSLPLDSVDFI